MFTSQHLEKFITKFNFDRLFSKAWLKATTPENVYSGFRKAGLVPFNPNAITVPTHDTKKNVHAVNEVDSIVDENMKWRQEMRMQVSTAMRMERKIVDVKTKSNKENVHGRHTPTVTLVPEKQALFERRFE